MTEEMDDEMLVAHQAITECVSELVSKNADPLCVAALLVQHGLMIYKTVLPINDFNNIVSYIVKNKDKIKDLNEPEKRTLQ